MDNNRILKSGINELDDLFYGGFRKGKVYVFGARPKIGKTRLLFGIAYFMSVIEKHNAFYQHTDRYDERVLNYSNICYRAGSIVNFDNFVKELKEYISQNSIDVVFIDSINEGKNKFSFDYFKVLYELAKDFKIAVIVSSCLNRNLYRRKNLVLKIEDVKIGGDYCNYSERIILLNNIYRYDNENISDEEREKNWGKLMFAVYDNQKRRVGNFEQDISFIEKI